MPENHAQPVAAWLVLAAGTDREHMGNDGYDDEPALHYSWDSTVYNHAALQPGDPIVLRDKHQLLGASVIEEIAVGEGIKDVFRCPECGRASLKERTTMSPRFSCFRCHAAFDQPEVRQASVTTYRSRHDVGWIDLSGALPIAELRAVCENPRTQHSLRRLRWEAFSDALGIAAPTLPLSVIDRRQKQLRGGHTERTVRARVGQSGFRRRLLEKYGDCCAIAGPTPAVALDAAHLYSYAATGFHEENGGFLVRRDIHRLFDLGLIAITADLTVDVATSLARFDVYSSLHGTSLKVNATATQKEWLRLHWAEHRV